MNERPKALILSAPMMRAILEGKKTQIRREVQPQPATHRTTVHDMPDHEWCFSGEWPDGSSLESHGGWPDVEVKNRTCPFGQPGDRLWMPETWRWPSLGLELTEVRVQRLQEMSEADAIAQGVELTPRVPGELCDWWKDYGDPLNSLVSARDSFRTLWESVNGAGSWAANPWVWVGTFRRVDAAERAA